MTVDKVTIPEDVLETVDKKYGFSSKKESFGKPLW